MNTRKVTQEYRMNQWIGIVSECRDSGQTVTSWCEDHGINLKSYYYWLRKIRKAACETLPTIKTEGQIVPLDIQETLPSIPKEVKQVPSEVDVDIVLRLGSAVLEIHNNASAGLIESIIRILSNAR
jgi:putative transposase